MLSSVRAAVAGWRVVVTALVMPLAAAGCGTGLGTSYDADPLARDPTNLVVALDAQSRGDDKGAMRAYERLLRNSGHPLAEMEIGRRLADGRGAPKDPVRATALLQSAYEKDWPRRGDAAFFLARQVEAGAGTPKDPARAFALYRFARDRGVRLASFPLARAYEEGAVVPADPAQAAAYYREAATLGDARASLRLAELRLQAGDPPAAVHPVARDGVAWLRELAKQDNDWAEMRLATIFAEGTLAPASEELAERYLRDAAKHGNASANVRLAEREEQAGQPKRALAHWRRAAEAGHTSALVKVGYAELDEGRTEAGLALMERAAAEGHPSAMVELGRRSLAGDGRPKDPEAGRALLVKAADLGHPSAMYALGQAYADGNGAPKSRAQARTWLERARTAGHPSAEKALAQL